MHSDFAVQHMHRVLVIEIIQWDYDDYYYVSNNCRPILYCFLSIFFIPFRCTCRRCEIMPHFKDFECLCCKEVSETRQYTASSNAACITSIEHFDAAILNPLTLQIAWRNYTAQYRRAAENFNARNNE